ncbi:MAG: YneF family protein [Mollicutes bacterium UO1]
MLVAPAALLIGVILGYLVTNYILKKQMQKWQKQMEKPNKEQVRNMLSALGQKPSEEQVNRFINMTENLKKKKKPDKAPKKKK